MQTQTTQNIGVEISTSSGKLQILKRREPGLWIRNFFTRITHWEFWPFNVLYAPVFFYWIWLVIKARSPYFFVASNPGIEYGGMLGESKFKILSQIPDGLKPKTLLFNPGDSMDFVVKQLENQKIIFPILVKPDVGERGWMVQKISNSIQLQKYLLQSPVKFLIQEYIDLPLELGIFYYRYPDADFGTISSVTAKRFLEIEGDGEKTVSQLMKVNSRARLQFNSFKKRDPELLEYVPLSGEKLKLMPIGNHCLGTKFLNGEHLINRQLVITFDRIAREIPGFFFGRFDIRCKNLEDLYRGKIQILELNGAGSEPSHIYQPGFSLWKAYEVIIHHLRVLFEISVHNHKKGTAYLSPREGWTYFMQIRQNSKLQNHRINA